MTIVGRDRAGLVAAVAEIVTAHGGNWENSQLAELAGTFAGVVQIAVAPARADELRRALTELEGLLDVTVHRSDETAESAPDRRFELLVLGNDHPGIVRKISAALDAQGLSIEQMSTETRDAAMAGGRLFEATITAAVPAAVDMADLKDELERLAAEIQVDVTLIA